MGVLGFKGSNRKIYIDKSIDRRNLGMAVAGLPLQSFASVLSQRAHRLPVSLLTACQHFLQLSASTIPSAQAHPGSSTNHSSIILSILTAAHRQTRPPQLPSPPPTGSTLSHRQAPTTTNPDLWPWNRNSDHCLDSAKSDRHSDCPYIDQVTSATRRCPSLMASLPRPQVPLPPWKIH